MTSEGGPLPAATAGQTPGPGHEAPGELSSVRGVLLWATLIGLAACGLVLFVIYGLGSARPENLDLSFLPPVNATLNGLAALCLIGGRLAISRGREQLHRRFMVLALIVSSLFLVSYLAYHSVHGDTRYPAEAPFRLGYLILLASHVLGSILVLPLVLASVSLAVAGKRRAHRAVARLAWPLWLYVSITGIAVFGALRMALG